MKEKTLSVLLVFLLLSNFLSASVLADNTRNTGITVKSVKTDLNKIYEGQSFNLDIIFENNTGRPNEDIKNAMVEINNSDNFSLKDSGSKKTILFDGTASEFTLIYHGKENTQLPITLHYSLDDKEVAIEDYISIYNAVPTKPEKEPEKEDPIDESKYVPNISIVGNKTVLGKAGDNVRLPVKIKNTGEHRARNISASITIEETKGIYIDGSGYDDVSSLSSGDDKTLYFRIEVDKFAEEKTYPISVKFHYFNQYDKAFETTDTMYLRISGDGNEHQLIVDQVLLSPEEDIKPGGNVVVGFSLRNLSLIPVRDVKVSLVGLEKEGFTLTSGTNRFTVSGIGSKSTAFVQFPLRVSQKMKAGNQELKLNIAYKNLLGNTLEDEHQFFIPIKGSSKQNSNLIIENIKSPTTIKANSNATVSFDLRNRGQNDARDIIVKVDLPDTDGLVPKSVTTIKIDNLAPGEKRNLSFSFFSTKEAPTKNYPINIKVEHSDDFIEGDELYTLDQYLGIFVDNPSKDEKSSVPKLIIDKYSFGNGMVEAGKNFDMVLSFYNTNSTKSVKNIKIYLTAEQNVSEGEGKASDGSSVFTPVNSSNTFYIDSIPPKGRVEKSITMFTIPDAAAKTHVITANLEYEDGKAEAYEATELIGVPVYQKSKLEVAELTYFPDVNVGDPVPISVEFYNTGKVTLYNMMVRLEGDFQMENATYYIGNFDAGTSEYFDGTVIPTGPGELSGNVVFTFEDSTGEEQEIKRPFTLNVSEFVDEPFPEFPEEEEKSFFSKFKWPLLGILTLALGLGGFKFYKKKKQEKEDRDLLDE